MRGKSGVFHRMPLVFFQSTLWIIAQSLQFIARTRPQLLQTRPTIQQNLCPIEHANRIADNSLSDDVRAIAQTQFLRLLLNIMQLRMANL